VISITIAVPATIGKSFTKYPNNVPGEHIKELQKAAIMANVHILRNVYNYKWY
jgi:hypothetical protein